MRKPHATAVKKNANYQICNKNKTFKTQNVTTRGHKPQVRSQM